MASPPLCVAISAVKKTSSSVTAPPTRQGPCSGSARSEAPREAIAKTSGLWSVGAPKKKGRRRALVSADRGPQARLLSGRDFVDSSIPDGAAELTRGGRVWRSGLAVAKCIANGRECLTKQCLPLYLCGSLAGGSSARRSIRLHWVQRAGLCQKFIASSARKVEFYGWVLRKFGIVAR